MSLTRTPVRHSQRGLRGILRIATTRSITAKGKVPDHGNRYPGRSVCGRPRWGAWPMTCWGSDLAPLPLRPALRAETQIGASEGMTAFQTPLPVHMLGQVVVGRSVHHLTTIGAKAQDKKVTTPVLHVEGRPRPSPSNAARLCRKGSSPAGPSLNNATPVGLLKSRRVSHAPRWITGKILHWWEPAIDWTIAHWAKCLFLKKQRRRQKPQRRAQG